MDKLLATAHKRAKDFTDPENRITLRELKRDVNPIGRKLEILNTYVTSMTPLLPLAAGDDEDTMNMDAISKELAGCMEALEKAQVECSEFYGIIEDFEEAEKKKKEVKTDRSSARPRDDDKPPEIKGITSALKPEELTTSVAAQDIALWLEVGGIQKQ